MLIYFLACLAQGQLYAQPLDLSGTWKGQLYQEDKSAPFITEMTLVQKGTSILGTARVTATGQSYALFRLRGSIKGKSVQLYDIQVLEEKSGFAWYWCKKVYVGTVGHIKGTVVFKGQWTNDQRKMYRQKALILNSGVSCSPGTFNLTKEIEEQDKVETISPQPDTALFPVSTAPLNSTTDAVFRNRKIEVKNRIAVSADTLVLNFYDNGDIDNDTISVYYNKQLILQRQRLSEKPLTVKIAVQRNIDNEILMFADNEGLIPPNTAILIFETDGSRHEISIDSNLKSSGSVCLYRE